VPGQAPDRFTRCLSLLSLGMIAILAGCSGTSTSFTGNSLETLSDRKPKAGHERPILVELRFPALVSESAEIPLARSFTLRTGGAGATATGTIATQDSTASLSKSTYYALEFYAALSRHLPEGSIILSPYELRTNAQGLLVESHFDKDASPPALLTVEFLTLHAPGAKDVLEAKWVTFGDLITPLIVVRTAPENSPATDGLLAVSEPIIAPAGSARGMRVASDKISFTSYLNYGPAHLAAPRAQVVDGEAPAPGKVLRLPVEKLQMASESDNPSRKALQSAFSEVIKPHVSLVVALLNQLDETDALRPGLARWSRLYATTAPRDGAASARTQQLLAKVYQLEKKFLSKRAEKLYERVQDGDSGQIMRKLLQQEREVLAERRALANQQDLSFAATIGASVLSGVAAYKGENELSSVAQSAATLAGQSYTEAAALSARLAATFRTEFSAIYEGHHEYSVSAVKGEQAFVASTMAELRRKAKTYYDQNQKQAM